MLTVPSLPTDLEQTYIARILEVNSTLHAVTELNPDAVSIAAELDAERSRGTVRGSEKLQPWGGYPLI